MHRGWRAALAAMGVLLVTAVVLPSSAAASAAPTLEVTPNTGLRDGQLVSVRGTGYSGTFAVGALECPPQFAGRTEFTIAEVLAGCGFLVISGSLDPDASGAVAGSVAVQEVFSPSTSTAPSYDCTVRNDCVLLVAGLAGSGLRGASVPIRFGPATPATKADCRHGGWRTVADGSGQPFRNQGQCVRFVVAR
jgi:hypothetical protein